MALVRTLSILLLLLAGWLATDLALCADGPSSWYLVRVHLDDSGRPAEGLELVPLAPGGAVSPLAGLRQAAPGAYLFSAAADLQALAVRKPGYVTGWALPEPEKEGLRRFPDLVLTPRAEGQRFTGLAGADLHSPDGRTRLDLPPGAFAGNFPLHLTPLSAQALPGLPLGWSPSYALHLGPDDQHPQTPLTLRLPRPEAGDPMVVRFDPGQGRWLRLEGVDEGDRIVLALTELGTLAVVSPDPGRGAPPIPQPGQPLIGSAAGPVRQAVELDLSLAPEALFLMGGSGARLQVRASAQTLPSGSRVALRLLEHYRFADDSRLISTPRRRTLTLYRAAEGLAAEAQLSPDPGFRPGAVA